FNYLFSHYFFFNDTATTALYTLSLHDALPIWSRRRTRECRCPRRLERRHRRGRDGVARRRSRRRRASSCRCGWLQPRRSWSGDKDRKSTRLNSSHVAISYAVFCLKKKKKSIDE